MQFLLSKEELEKGSQLIHSHTTEEFTIDNIYEEQEKLNNKGFFTVIKDLNCDEGEELKFKIDVYQRDCPIVQIG